MLTRPTKSIKNVLKRLDRMRFALEYKYDGKRLSSALNNRCRRAGIVSSIL